MVPEGKWAIGIDETVGPEATGGEGHTNMRDTLNFMNFVEDWSRLPSAPQAVALGGVLGG